MAKWVYKKYNKGYAWSAEVSGPQTIVNYHSPERFLLSMAPAWMGNGYNTGGSTSSRSIGNSQPTNTEFRAYHTYWRALDKNSSGGWDWASIIYERTSTISAGTYIGEVIAEDGTYPANGLHSDGFWYVRDRLAFPEMWCNINGVNRKAVEGWVNINGSWRAISDIWVNINGAWRKSE